MSKKVLFIQHNIEKKVSETKWYDRLLNIHTKINFLKDCTNIDVIINICQQNKITIILPIYEDDCILLDYNREKLRKFGISFIVPHSDLTISLYNKTKFVDLMLANNLGQYIPKKYKTIQYPCVLKKNVSYAGRDVYIINKKDDIPKHINLSDYVIQEPIDGNCEYSTDILAKDGIIYLHTTSKYYYNDKLYVQYAKTLHGCIKKRSIVEINQYALESFYIILKILNFSGFCNIDYKMVDTIPKIFEINSRIGGSMRYNGNKLLSKFIKKYYKLAKN